MKIRKVWRFVRRGSVLLFWHIARLSQFQPPWLFRLLPAAQAVQHSHESFVLKSGY